MKKRILVLGVVPSLTWAVARCLRLAGRAPHVLAWHRWSPLMLSADCRRYVHWSGLSRSSAGLNAGWYAGLNPSALWQVRELCRKARIEAVLGADYDTALLLAGAGAGARDEVPACAVPSASTIATFNDKWNLVRLLDQLDLPHPQSRWIADPAALLQADLPFPMITKPLDLWASVGFQVHQERAQLARTLARRRLAARFPLIAQSYVPGWDVGASFLARAGKLVAYSVFRQQRRGERVFYDCPRVRDYVERFIAACGYSGVGHLDLRYDPASDRYAILELNPRFWASLLYAAQAGLNYPELLLRLDELAGRLVLTARPGAVRLPWYETAMTLSNRWFASAYEKATGARL